MTTAWAYLPNAKHLDRILESRNEYFDLWNQDDQQITCGMEKDVYDGKWDEAWYTASTSLNGRLEKVWSSISSRAIQMARSPILALLVYDDCGYMIDSDPSELSLLAALGDNRAILCLPAAIVFNEIKKIS